MAWRRSSWRNKEKPKDHEALPDTLDTGYTEIRDANGQLRIILQEQPVLSIVLGKYKHTQKGGVVYYVTGHTISPLLADKVHKFDHLLLAIAQVHELIQKFEERKRSNEDLHD